MTLPTGFTVFAVQSTISFTSKQQTAVKPESMHRPMRLNSLEATIIVIQSVRNHVLGRVTVRFRFQNEITLEISVCFLPLFLCGQHINIFVRVIFIEWELKINFWSFRERTTKIITFEMAKNKSKKNLFHPKAIKIFRSNDKINGWKFNILFDSKCWLFAHFPLSAVFPRVFLIFYFRLIERGKKFVYYFSFLFFRCVFVCMCAIPKGNSNSEMLIKTIQNFDYLINNNNCIIQGQLIIRNGPFCGWKIIE